MPVSKISVNWRQWRARLFWGLFLSLPIGILGSYTGGLILEERKRLVVDWDSSYKAGQTVIDVTIWNDGDYDLVGLHAYLVFEKPSVVHIEPEHFKRFASLNGKQLGSSVQGKEFQLSVPPDVELKKGQYVELRCYSDGRNGIRNLNSIREDIHGQYVETVFASRARDFWLVGIAVKDQIIVAGLIILAIAVCMLLYLVLKLRRLAMANVQQREKDQ